MLILPFSVVMLSLWCKCANGLAAPQDSRYRVMRTEALILAPSRVCRGLMWCWGLRFSPWLTENKRWYHTWCSLLFEALMHHLLPLTCTHKNLKMLKPATLNYISGKHRRHFWRVGKICNANIIYLEKLVIALINILWYWIIQ